MDCSGCGILMIKGHRNSLFGVLVEFTDLFLSPITFKIPASLSLSYIFNVPIKRVVTTRVFDISFT